MPTPITRQQLNDAITEAAQEAGISPEPFIAATAGHKHIARGEFDSGDDAQFPRCLCPVSCALVAGRYGGNLPHRRELMRAVNSISPGESKFAGKFDSITAPLVRAHLRGLARRTPFRNYRNWPDELDPTARAILEVTD